MLHELLRYHVLKKEKKTMICRKEVFYDISESNGSRKVKIKRSYILGRTVGVLCPPKNEAF